MITQNQYTTIDEIFDYYNVKLFDGKLKDCMIITSRKKDAAGYFQYKAWKNKAVKKDADIHEICLNPDFFNNDDMQWQKTLVHIMVHIYQYDHGKPSRRDYHNLEWAEIMEKIGLMPSSKGKPGGERTGFKMSEYPVPGGMFIEAYNSLKDKNIKYIFSSKAEENDGKPSNSKESYTCPACGTKMWGKKNILAMCVVCM